MRTERSNPVALRFAWAALALAFAACSAPPPPEAPAMQPAHDPFVDKVAVVEAHESLLAAMESGDGEGVAGLLDRAHDVLVFHPASDSRFDGPDTIAGGVARMLASQGPIDVTEVHLQVWVDGDVAWLTSHLLVESPRREEPLAARGTEVWRRSDGGWRLAHAHWSAQPPE